MPHKLIHAFDAQHKLFQDSASGLAWVEDGTAGIAHSCHPNVARGRASGWGKDDLVGRIRGFNYNISQFTAVDKWDKIAARYCKCGGSHGDIAEHHRRLADALEQLTEDDGITPTALLGWMFNLTRSDVDEVMDTYQKSVEGQESEGIKAITVLDIKEWDGGNGPDVKAVRTFPATKAGEEAAKKLFADWVREGNSGVDPNDIDIDEEIEETWNAGVFEMGSGGFLVVRS